MPWRNSENLMLKKGCKINDKASKTTFRKARGITLKALSFAALAGLSLFGLQANAAAEKSAITDASLATLSRNAGDILLSYKVGEKEVAGEFTSRKMQAKEIMRGIPTGAAASIPVLTDGIYTVTETTYSDAPNVFKYVATDGSHTQVSVWYGIC